MYQCFTLGTLKNWFVMCGGRSSILHYGPLIETNNLYAPTPNGQSPSASLNKSNTPPAFAYEAVGVPEDADVDCSYILCTLLG